MFIRKIARRLKKKAIFYTDKFLSVLRSYSLDFSIVVLEKNLERRATLKDLITPLDKDA